MPDAKGPITNHAYVRLINATTQTLLICVESPRARAPSPTNITIELLVVPVGRDYERAKFTFYHNSWSDQSPSTTMTYSPLAPRMLSTSVSSRLHVACRTKDNYDRVCKSLRQRYISVRENENRDTTTQNKNNHICVVRTSAL